MSAANKSGNDTAATRAAITYSRSLLGSGGKRLRVEQGSGEEGGAEQAGVGAQ